MTELGDAEHAQALEDDAERYPDERGELLLEAAEAWRHAGDDLRAVRLLEQVVAGGGEDADRARVSLAESYFELGRDDDALAQLERLRAGPPSSPWPCQMAGELLEERGDLQEALAWFDLAVSLLSPEELTALGEPGGWLSAGAVIARGRHRIRRALGLPRDDLDSALPELPWRPEPGGFPSAAEVLDSAPERIPAGEVRTLFWQVEELREATRRWPDVFGGEGVADGTYHATLEGRWRELAQRGVARLTLVPGTADGLARFAEDTGGDPGDSGTRRGYMDQLVAAGVGIAWPPARNGGCWCGSGVKYKKCCRPAGNQTEG
jgi:tetratricopeptide (TPR) repeat protein